MAAKRKDPNAVALGSKGGKARASSLSASRLSEIGKQGASARMEQISQARRREIARNAVKARWAKKRKEEQ